MKKLLCLSLVAVFASILTGCNGKKSDKEVTLVMAEVNPEGTISAEMDKAFKEKVEELSGGKIKVDLNFGGTLGDEQTIMKLLTKPHSTIQLERISAFNLAPYGCEKSTLLAIPFTFSSKNHFWNFANSSLADQVLAEPYEKNVGIRGLFFGEEGFRHFFATQPLTSIEDFNGRKMRVTSDPVMLGIAHGLKTNPVSVNFSDLYSALQTGVADGAEQPIANYLANHFHRIAPYMILDGHTLGVTEVIIAAEAWNSLSENQQKILIEAGKYAGEVCRKFSQEAEDKAMMQLEADGAKFTAVNDITPWQEACADIITKSANIAPELYKEILDFSK